MFNIKSFEEHTKQHPMSNLEFKDWKRAIHKMVNASSHSQLMELNNELGYRQHGLWMLYMGLEDWDAVTYCTHLRGFAVRAWTKAFARLCKSQDDAIKMLLEK